MDSGFRRNDESGGGNDEAGWQGGRGEKMGSRLRGNKESAGERKA